MIAGLRRIAGRMRIQYASDLHLEFAENGPFQPILTPVAPVLALAGDVGRPDKPLYRDFLHYCSHHWESVFVVAGNHELYNNRVIAAYTPSATGGELYNTRPAKNWRHMPEGSVDTVAKRLARCAEVAAEFPNVHFLDRQRIVYKDIAFLGCTLWTDLKGMNAVTAATSMNDYRLITEDGAQPITTDTTNRWHQRDRAWLAAELEACEEEARPAVVLTHHLPTYDLIASRYQGHPLNAAFASAADELIQSPVRAWICGHTHTGAHRTWRHTDGSVTLGAVNPRGYPGETGTGYSREIYVDIATESGPLRGGDTRDPLLVAAAVDVEGVAGPKRRVSVQGDLAEDEEIEFK